MRAVEVLPFFLIFVIVYILCKYNSRPPVQSRSTIHILHPASPFIAIVNSSSWCDPAMICPGSGEPAIVSLHWSGTNLRWKIQVSNDTVPLHGAAVRPSSTSSFDMSTGYSFKLLSNQPENHEVLTFRPASHIVLARCLYPANLLPVHFKNRYRKWPKKLISCIPDTNWTRLSSPSGHKPCLYAQDIYRPEKFQHALINSVPTLGLASLVKRYLLPDSILVGTYSQQNKSTGETSMNEGSVNTWMKWDQSSRCGMTHNNTTREWIFIGTESPHLAANDCYPVGSFDRFRREVAVAGKKKSKTRDLLLFASRANGGSRMPRGEDAAALELWLEKTLAPELGLIYSKTDFHTDSKTMRSSFSNARLIFAPHGGALTNIAYAHESTVVIELSPQFGIRFCFACMAYAMRFSSYAIFIPSWASGYGNQLPYALNISDLQLFWDSKVKDIYFSSQQYSGTYLY